MCMCICVRVRVAIDVIAIYGPRFSIAIEKQCAYGAHARQKSSFLRASREAFPQ